MDMQQTMIFQWILQILQKHYGWTDRRINQWTDQRTDIPSLKNEIAASENMDAIKPQDFLFHLQLSMAF